MSLPLKLQLCLATSFFLRDRLLFVWNMLNNKSGKDSSQIYMYI